MFKFKCNHYLLLQNLSTPNSLFFQKKSSDDYISISTGTLNKNIPSIGHIFYKYKKSKINFSKLKKFPQSAQGYFDKFIYRIK